jgi:DNA mismatch endonuclease (patch repair protein)
MADVFTPEKRRSVMQSIGQKNTSPEMSVRIVAHALGLRFRLHRKDLPGTPDLVFPRYRIAILVHGCFWHRHPGCGKAYMPKSRVEFWEAKFRKNVARDARTLRELKESGWCPQVIWECETKDRQALERRIKAIFGIRARY